MQYIAPKPEGALHPRAECEMSPWIPSTRDITNLYPEEVNSGLCGVLSHV